MSKVIHFTVSRGKVEVRVTGQAGPECTRLTSTLNKNLGSKLVAQELTDEFYEQPDAVQNTTTQSQSVTY